MFEQSRVPLTLVDRDRRLVAVNEAAVALFHCRSALLVGAIAGSNIEDDVPSLGDRLWEQLLRDNEVYAEHLVSHRSGTPLRVSFAAHGTTIDGRWLALFVALSARFEPDGTELIRTAGTERVTLTPREREVVRRVALGETTARIAAGLFLSPATVRTHIGNAMAKVNAHTRAQLVAIMLGER
jgi:DNA-binding CsgD family transcriptional regulator